MYHMDIGIMLEYLMTVHRMGRHMMEKAVLNMLQRWLQYVEELTSWIENETNVVDLGGWLPRLYVVENDNDFRWRRM